jgi:tetratricopeptide (TPR) repeat protein
VVTWRHGRCLPYGEGITFWALGEIVKAQAGILESDDRSVAATKVAETVAMLFEEDADRAWFESRLAPLVGAGGDGTGASREESFTAWRRFLEAMAARRPTVLVVEDLHWADAALLEFLEHLLEWTSPVPLLLLCTARPELYERQPSWGGGKRNATTISLSPLSSEEAGRLLQVLLGRTVLPAETQASLLERAGGNPLYAEQFARMLAETGDAVGLSMPETVQALVAARLDTLRPDLKGLLYDAAVVGRVFWSGAAAAIGERDRDAVRRDLNELARREFVRPVRASSIDREEEFSFWHALVRDVAYQQIPRAPRAEKHLAAARWVERTAEDRLEDHAEILVYHYGQALELAHAAGETRPDVEQALVRFLLLSGDRAAQLDTEAAEAYFRRAVALSGGDDVARARALARLAPVLGQRGAVDESLEAAKTAVETLRMRDPQVAALVLNHLATVSWTRGEMTEAEVFQDEAAKLLERQPTPALVAVYGGAAHRAAIGGRVDDAEAFMEKGFALAATLGVEDVTALLNARATLRGYGGDPACLDDLRDAIAVGRRLGLGRSTAVAMNNLGDALAYFVGLREARQLLDAAVEFSASRGLTYAGMWQRGERLRSLYHLGEWDELRREADVVIPWVRDHGGGQLEVIARIYVTDFLVHAGAIDEAAASAAELLSGARDSGDPQVLVPGLTAAALVSWAQRDEGRALSFVEELDEATDRSAPYRDHCLVWPSRIAIALGAEHLAESFLDDEEYDAAWNRCARLTARAMLAEARGEAAEASGLYREAGTRWEAYGSIVEQAYALLGLGRCGDAKALVDGEAIFARLGAAPVLAKAA